MNFVCRVAPDSSVTKAPIASRLLAWPLSRKTIDSPMPSRLLRKILTCGPVRFLRTSSKRPSWSKSLNAYARQSSIKSSPSTPETSEKLPSLLLAKNTFL